MIAQLQARLGDQSAPDIEIFCCCSIRHIVLLTPLNLCLVFSQFSSSSSLVIICSYCFFFCSNISVSKSFTQRYLAPVQPTTECQLMMHSSCALWSRLSHHTICNPKCNPNHTGHCLDASVRNIFDNPFKFCSIAQIYSAFHVLTDSLPQSYSRFLISWGYLAVGNWDLTSLAFSMLSDANNGHSPNPHNMLYELAFHCCQMLSS